MPQLVILWTDALIFLLIALSLTFGMLAVRKEHLRAPWRRVARSRVGMGALVILSAYVLIGVVDSIHYNPPLEQAEPGGPTHSSEVLSLLDTLLTPLRERSEKTYSAPLATHLYAKETIEQADGSTIRDYPRLQHGGVHLADPEKDWAGDIVTTMLIGVVEGLIAWVILAALLIALLAHRAKCGFGEQLKNIRCGATEIPWSVVLMVLAILLMVAFVSGNLGLKYHLLGTDKVGQDVFYQSLKSIRTGLMIGTLTSTTSR